MDNSGGLFLYCFCSCIILSYCCSLLLSVFALFPRCMLIDSCYLLFTHYPGAPKKTTDKLQRVLNAAARVVSNSRKYDRGLTQFRHQTIHWLDVADRIKFRLGVQVYKCQHGMAPAYLEDLCRPVSDIDGRWHLRSARRGLLDVPRVELPTYRRRSFSYATAWNALPDYLKNSTLSLSVFRNQLKHFLFSSTNTSSAFEVITEMRYINYLLTYLHTKIFPESKPLVLQYIIFTAKLRVCFFLYLFFCQENSDRKQGRILNLKVWVLTEIRGESKLIIYTAIKTQKTVSCILTCDRDSGRRLSGFALLNINLCMYISPCLVRHPLHVYFGNRSRPIVVAVPRATLDGPNNA